MIKYYLYENGYFVGPEEEMPSSGAVEVPIRPDWNYDWNGNEWILRETPYFKKRTLAYPPIGDQLDAILKYLQDKSNLPADLLGIIEAWQQVKKDYPKS